MQTTLFRRRDQLDSALGIDHVNVIVVNVGAQRASQLSAFGFLHGDVVFNVYGVEHLAAETLAHQAGTDAFTRRVDCRRRACRAAADDQHFIGFALVQLFRRALLGVGVDLADDLSKAHAALTELFAVQVDRRYAHHVALGNFILEHAAVNRRVRDARVDNRHQVQRLHHVRAVVA